MNTTSNLTANHNNPRQGILWKTIASFCFAGVNSLVRSLSGGSLKFNFNIPVSSILFYQSLIGIILLSPWWLLRKRSPYHLTNARLLPWQFLRILLSSLGIGCWYLSVEALPIAHAIIINGCVAPIVSLIAARLFLQEHLGRYRLIALLISGVGSIIIIYKQLNNSVTYRWYTPYVLLPMLAGISFSLSNICTRYLSQRGNPPQVLTSLTLLGLAPLSYLTARNTLYIPNLTEIPWLFLLGFLGFLAYFASNKTLSVSQVTFLLPLKYLHYFASILVSLLVFAEYPNTLELNVGLICLALTLFFLDKEARKNKSTN